MGHGLITADALMVWELKRGPGFERLDLVFLSVSFLFLFFLSQLMIQLFKLALTFYLTFFFLNHILS